MSWFSHRKKTLIYSGVFILLIAYFLVVHPRLRVPPPRTHSYLIFAGSVSRALVQHSHTKSRTGKLSPPRLPHHLEFTSSNGPAEVYVLNFSDLDSQSQVAEMLNQTNALIAGHPPDDYVAKAAGMTGQIPLHSWPYGRVSYVVLIHAQQESKVVLEVHYGP